MQRLVSMLAGLAALGATPALHAQVFDHLHCHKIKDPVAKARYTADLVPGDPALPLAPGCLVKTPAKLLCTDVAKTNVDPPPPGAAPGPQALKYLCYKAKCPKVDTPVAAADQFGDRAVTLRSSSLLCAPVPGSAPPTTSSTTTSTTTSTSATTTTSTSTTTSTTLPPGPSAGCPVVNELMTGGSTSAGEEFVEVLNPCGHTVDLSGAKLVYRSAAGTSDLSLVLWTAGTVLPPGGRLVYGSATFAGPKDGELLAGLAATGGGVAVRDPLGGLADSVGYGTATNAFVETQVAAAPAAGSSIGRVPDGADTDDNAADWLEGTITPGAPNAAP
jgi:hypothetical protein